MATMNQAIFFGAPIAGGYAGYKLMKKHRLLGAAAGAFLGFEGGKAYLTSQPPSGVYLTSAPTGQGLSSGTGALLVLGGIAVAVLYGNKILKKLGA
jgi:hypothetical protein